MFFKQSNKYALRNHWQHSYSIYQGICTILTSVSMIRNKDQEWMVKGWSTTLISVHGFLFCFCFKRADAFPRWIISSAFRWEEFLTDGSFKSFTCKWLPTLKAGKLFICLRANHSDPLSTMEVQIQMSDNWHSYPSLPLMSVLNTLLLFLFVAVPRMCWLPHLCVWLA